MPQTDYRYGASEPMRSGKGESEFLTPLYDRLETNIPRGLMGFSDLDWPEDCQLFPRHEEVLQYIRRYAEEVRHLIRFQVEVVDVRLDAEERWVVKTRLTSNNYSEEIEERKFDAVAICNGHFNVPFIPDVPGIAEWNKAYPGSILHSMFYRRPEDYAGKKVVVVGNSASGVDIGAQIMTACKLPLIQSSKSESAFLPESSPKRVEKPEIVEYIAKDRSIRFSDDTTEANIDAIVYCTGYFYSFPFLSSLSPPLTTTGEYVENLYQHIFYRPHPTLAFGVLNQKVIPFPLAEAQAAVVARVWSGRLELPSEAEMAGWEERIVRENGKGRRFHVLPFPKDADYINMLHDWAMSVDHKTSDSSTSHELRRRRMSSTSERKPTTNGNSSMNGSAVTVGKEPPYWGEKEYWTRERFPAIKKAFQGFGEERREKRTLESVGFSFEEWKMEREEEGRRLL